MSYIYLLYIHILVYNITYSMVQGPSWAADWLAASQEIPRISRNPKVHYRTHKRPQFITLCFHITFDFRINFWFRISCYVSLDFIFCILTNNKATYLTYTYGLVLYHTCIVLWFKECKINNNNNNNNNNNFVKVIWWINTIDITRHIIDIK